MDIELVASVIGWQELNYLHLWRSLRYGVRCCDNITMSLASSGHSLTPCLLRFNLSQGLVDRRVWYIHPYAFMDMNAVANVPETEVTAM